MSDYAKHVMVSTDWVAEDLEDDRIRIVEVDASPELYDEAHIPGAIGFDWKRDLQDPVRRRFLGAAEFAELIGSRGSQTSTPSCSTATAATGLRPIRTGTSAITGTTP